MSFVSPRGSRHWRVVSALVTLGLVALLVTGCGGSGSSGKVPGADSLTQVSAGSIAPGAVIPAPAGSDVVITITGGSATNAGKELRLSLAQLESMRTVTATVYEPFLKRNVTFQGVPLQDLLDIAGAPGDFTEIDSAAYNEYAVTLPATILRHAGVLLATRADGETIPLDKGGPTRVVFTDTHPDTKNESLWIWSTKVLALR